MSRKDVKWCRKHKCWAVGDGDGTYRCAYWHTIRLSRSGFCHQRDQRRVRFHHSFRFI